VQEKVQIERSASQRLGGSSQPPPRAQPKPQPAIDLFGDETPAPPRPSTGPPVGARAPPQAAPPKQNRAGDSLLGLDFMGGGPSSQPSRPSSTGPAAAVAPSRPDLKQSILSLYASKPAAPPQPQHARQESFCGLASPQGQASPQQSAFGGMTDAFGGLSFTQAAQPAPKPSPFSGLDSFSSTKSPPTTSSSNMFGGGGNFFDSAPKSPPTYQTPASSSGMGNFSSFTSTPAKSQPAASGLGDLLDLSMPSAPAPAPRAAPPVSSPPMNSAFNLSSPVAPSAPAPQQTQATSAPLSYGNMDAWGSNDVWASSAPSQPAPTATASHAAPKSPGWGAPQVAQDDDFGGWSSAAPTTQTTTTTHTSSNTKPAGGFGGGSDDLFSNVWE
jgi:stromal membrane-associated protein